VEEYQKALRRKLEIVHGEKPEVTKPSMQLKKSVLDQMVEKKLLVLEAGKRGITVADDELEREIAKYKSNYTELSFQKMLLERGVSNEEWVGLRKENLLVEKMMKAGPGDADAVPPEAVKKYYDEHPDEFKVPESVRVRQIVTDTKEKADSILRRLQNGENFAKLARDLSLSPDRKAGGDLGFIARGSFPREFDVCFSMNPGEISPIIPSIYGFHIFKVLERSEAKVLTLDEVKDKIEEQLKESARRDSAKAMLEQLKQQAKIEVHEDLLERITL